jgi:hypothetical protein
LRLLHHLDGLEYARPPEAIHGTEQPHHVQTAGFVCAVPHCLPSWMFPVTHHNQVNCLGPVRHQTGTSCMAEAEEEDMNTNHTMCSCASVNCVASDIRWVLSTHQSSVGMQTSVCQLNNSVMQPSQFTQADTVIASSLFFLLTVFPFRFIITSFLTS